jgi:hypothetical protein
MGGHICEPTILEISNSITTASLVDDSDISLRISRSQEPNYDVDVASPMCSEQTLSNGPGSSTVGDGISNK